MLMQRCSRHSPDDYGHLADCNSVLPQAALWGKGESCSIWMIFVRHAHLIGKYVAENMKSPLHDNFCGFKVSYYLLKFRKFCPTRPEGAEALSPYLNHLRNLSYLNLYAKL